MIKVSEEKYKEILENVEKLSYTLISIHKKENGLIRVEIQDNFGYCYFVPYFDLMKGKPPLPMHSNNPFSIDNIDLWIKNNNKRFVVRKNQEYISATNKLNFYCFDCEKIFITDWHRIKRGDECNLCNSTRCVNATNNVASTNPELLKDWDYVRNTISPEEIRRYSKKEVWWICNKCRNSWRTRLVDKEANSTCENCRKNKSMNTDKIKELIYNVFGDEYVVISNYVNSLTKIKMYHSLCGKSWDVIPYSIYGEETGCPNCKMLKGEKRLENFLLSKEVLFTKQKKFDNCKNINKLPFDFYLPDYNLAIEYDGSIHFEDKFDNPDEFELVKLRDSIKTKYCEDNNIPLLRIPYWEFNNIEKILTEKLGL